jgi:hypothetical protein
MHQEANQNDVDNLQLIAAEAQLLRSAGCTWRLQRLLVVFTPILLALLSIPLPFLKAWAGVVGIFFSILAVAFLDEFGRNDQIQAGKCREVFDRRIMGMHWDRIRHGATPDVGSKKHAVERYVRKYANLDSLKDYYPAVVFDLPHIVKQLAYQREILRQNLKKREQIRRGLKLIAWIVGPIILTIGLLAKLSVETMVLQLFAPISPLLSWLVIEYSQQARAIDRTETLSSEADSSLQLAITSSVPEETLRHAVNSIQDEIFKIRTEYPLLSGYPTISRPKGEGEICDALTETVKHCKTNLLALQQKSQQPNGETK